MALIVGTDTYITQADATAYIAAHYASASTQRVAWAALSSDDKDVWLRQGLAAIDRMLLIGVRAVQTQSLAFPRAILANGIYTPPTGYYWRDEGYVVQSEVPAAVKYAQAEEALAMLQGVPKRLQLRRQGVRSMRLGNLSETYSGSAGMTGLLSETAYSLLRQYLLGGVPIC